MSMAWPRPALPSRRLDTAMTAEEELVSRGVQSTVGLGTAVIVYGAAIGGLFALAFAAVYGRIGTLSPQATAGLLALLGFVAVYLVPALKYPANPPAVGESELIGLRTGLYLLMLVCSLVALAIATRLRRSFVSSQGAWNGTVLAAGVYFGAGVRRHARPAAHQRGAGQLLGAAVVELPHRLARHAGDPVGWPRAGLRPPGGALSRVVTRDGRAGTGARVARRFPAHWWPSPISASSLSEPQTG